MKIRKLKIHLKKPDIKKVFNMVDRALRGVKVPPP
jgi:hypothetical protein